MAAALWESVTIPGRALLPWMPAVVASDETLARVRHGASCHLPSLTGDRLVRVLDGGGSLLAVCRRIAGCLFQPHVVLIGQ